MEVYTTKRKVRNQNMTAMIQSCQNSGMTIKEWCFQNNVTEGSYYYWLHKIRETAILEKERNEIVQVTLPEMHLSSEEGILIKYQGVSLEIPAGTTSSDIVSILRAIKEVC